VISAIVLAAGLSRRMGSAKLLLDLQGQPVIRRSVAPLVGVVGEIVVVTGIEDSALREALAGLPVRFAVNPQPEQGQGTSIACGVRALGSSTRAAFVVLGDQPRLPAGLMSALLDALERSGKPIVAPVYHGGVQGNPVLFASEVFGELAALDGDAGARAVVNARPERVERVAIDAAMPRDLDTPEDYTRLRVE
jgi:molybdenum cofactor cytidylyltransferase